MHSRDSRTCSAWALVALLALLFAVLDSSASAADNPAKSTTATTSDSATTVASTHYETGLALYGLGHFEDAVSEFRKAYEVQARPEFLLHIGRSFEQLGQSEKAVYFFKRYLSTAPPDAAEREEAKEFVRKFEVEHPAPPSEMTTSPTAVPVSVDQIDQFYKEPLWHKWWVWTAVGVVVFATVGVGVLLVRGPDDGPPQSDLGHMRF